MWYTEYVLDCLWDYEIWDNVGFIFKHIAKYGDWLKEYEEWIHHNFQCIEMMNGTGHELEGN